MAHILVVDDEPDVRELFNITLKMAGHQTDTAKDGQEAVDKLAGRSPDLILLDLMMPRMDGFAFLSHIRARQDDKPMRVLIATAKVLEENDRQRLASWPVVGVLNKGELDVAQMMGTVSTALDRDPVNAVRNTESAAQPADKKESAGSKPVPPTQRPPATVSSHIKVGAVSRPGTGRLKMRRPGSRLARRKFW